MFVCLWLNVAKSALPTCPLTCIWCFVVICVVGGRAIGVFLCAWYLCAMYVKSNSNVHTKPKEYNYFGGDLHFDQVSFFGLLRLQSRERSDDLFISLCKSYPWHDRLWINFLIVDAPCAYMDKMYIRHYVITFRIFNYQVIMKCKVTFQIRIISKLQEN